ncbi:hypothetical protein SAMN04488242_0005 [Tessaracoccus oleiagri]|uniref:YdbS-like PH domain-containing protein n=2 Tax=Tessaracoccus oleiagri TaxID=686624 RepID=A0A1G9H0Q2_9ACTN|nr:hypothetical protein SAMN04488242_0005 [Tessaracoccus oleiagri]
MATLGSPQYTAGMSETAPATVDSLFEPPVERWERLSPKYLTVKLISIFIWWPILIAILMAALWFTLPTGWEWRSPLLVAAAVISLLWLAWRAIRAPFAFRRWGYAERDEDVYITHGLLFRQLTCVPYGRMQLVEVQAGPIDRLFGLATVQMVTASSTGAVAIPGLDRADAEAVRDRFINRGKHLQAGI